MDLSEFDLIGRIREKFTPGSGIVGIGDDCAVLPQKDGRCSLVTTDMLMEGTHFLLEDVSAYQLGWKSAAVNISDIAAMGGTPVGSFLSFALPSRLDSAWVDAFIEGFKSVSDKSGTPLLGGDTTRSERGLCICVSVLGECERGKAALRSGAQAGDVVCVTGTLGDSAAGLRVILDGLAREGEEAVLVKRHYLPVPRVEEGRQLVREGIHAMMDISDGIGSDLDHIVKASGVGAEIDCRLLPLSEEVKRCAVRHGWDAEHLAVDGGEDYELLFTLPPERECILSVPHTVIGRIVGGEGIVWKHSSGGSHQGFRHF